MQDSPILISPALEEIYLSPAELVAATASPLLDADGRTLRDEQGLPLWVEG